MTLCKYRPQRTYDAQFIFEQNDVNGLMKKLVEALEEHADNGEESTYFYMGAISALDVLFSNAERNGAVNMWTDFMELFAEDIERWGA